jgi:hypothetical protein
MAIWNILLILGIFYGHLEYFVFILYIFSNFGVMHQEKSGNSALDCLVCTKMDLVYLDDRTHVSTMTLLLFL